MSQSSPAVVRLPDDESPAPAEPVLRPVGPHFVIAPAGAPQAGLISALAGLRAAPQALIVLTVASAAAPVLRKMLPTLAKAAQSRGASALVLAASGLAAVLPDGTNRVEQMTGLAGMTVIAPDGVVAIKPDGTLSVTATAEECDASWWLCTPSGTPERLGPVWPVPSPVDAGPTANNLEPGLFAVTDVDAGCWLRPRSAAHAEPPRSLVEACAGPDTFVIVIGTPAKPSLALGRLTEVVGALPRTNRELLISAPWAAPAQLSAMAAGIADRLGHTVRASIGLPMRTADGLSSRILDLQGIPTWEPLLTELAAVPGRSRVVASRWRARPNGWKPQGAAVYHAFPGWVVELVPAGAWLRPEGRPAGCAPRFFTPDPHRALLIVGEQAKPVPEDIWGNFGPFLDDLPETGGNPLGLLVHGRTEPDLEAVSQFIARLHQLEWLPPDPPVLSRPAVAAAPAPPPLPLPAHRPDSEPGVTALVHTPALATPRPMPRPIEEVQLPAWPVDGVLSAERLIPPVSAAERISTVSTAGHTPDAQLPRFVGAQPQLPGAAEPARAETAEAAEAGEISPPSSPDLPATPAQVRTFTPEDFAVPTRTSGPGARDSVRLLLGDQYLRLASRADQVATRLPSLRSTTQDDIKPDLVAVLLYHADSGIPADRVEIAGAARSTLLGPLSGFVECLGSGLRRLPSHHGVVLLGADPSEAELAPYVPGSILYEPAAVTGLASHTAELGTAVEFVVWSTTGRRISLFGVPSDLAEVVFPPGTGFAVVEVLPGDGAGRPARILLRETGAVNSEGSQDQDLMAHERLHAWLDRRDGLDPAERQTVDRPERFHLTPGVALGN